ncbi:MAG: response regulator, partial [Thermodesulfovibrionales bacterium]
MQGTRVLIADDHTLVREGIIAMLSRFEDIEVVGEASNGKEAIEKVRDLRPDIILMDISMPVLGGLEATLEIKKSHPEVKILVLTQYDDKEYVSRFLKAGVSGYILKKALGMELLTAIRAVARGENYLHPSVAGSVIDRFVSKKKEH